MSSNSRSAEIPGTKGVTRFAFFEVGVLDSLRADRRDLYRNKCNFGGSFEIICNFGGFVVILVGPGKKCGNSSGSERNRCNFGGSRE